MREREREREREVKGRKKIVLWFLPFNDILWSVAARKRGELLKNAENQRE